ncbi:MAG TPA: transcription termination/antitermination NusG family protein [Bryobacteraceae bacterium]|nr:transcription termination/antitermination NusG family protein [Bryobacteraceae bacterium]
MRGVSSPGGCALEESSYQALEPGAQRYWFALHTKRNREKSVGQLLRAKGYEELVPTYRSLRKWSDRYKQLELVLFPGYVFCRFDPAKRGPILATPGVAAVVGNGRVPIPLENSEIDALRRVIGSELPVEPWPYLRVGQRVAIEGGPLTGLEGILQEVRRSCRIVVSVDLLQRSVAVEVDRDRVRPLGTDSARDADSRRRRRLAVMNPAGCAEAAGG